MNKALYMSTAHRWSQKTSGSVETVFFKVVDRPVAYVIGRCDYGDIHVDIIRPRQRIVELDDATTVTIII